MALFGFEIVVCLFGELNFSKHPPPQGHNVIAVIWMSLRCHVLTCRCQVNKWLVKSTNDVSCENPKYFCPIWNCIDLWLKVFQCRSTPSSYIIWYIFVFSVHVNVISISDIALIWMSRITSEAIISQYYCNTYQCTTLCQSVEYFVKIFIFVNRCLF